MDDAPLISAFFVISGRDFDPDMCSGALGLQPTKIWRQEREFLKFRQDLSNVEWQIGFERKPLYSTDDAVAQVLEIIWPVRDRVRAFLSASNLKAVLACNVTILKDRPEYCLSPAAMNKLAFLECEFCLDIFDYSE